MVDKHLIKPANRNIKLHKYCQSNLKEDNRGAHKAGKGLPCQAKICSNYLIDLVYLYQLLFKYPKYLMGHCLENLR